MSMLRILSASSRRALPTAMLAVGALAGTIQCDIRAADFTWNNTNGVWSDPTKWQGGVIPPSGTPSNDLFFGGSDALLYMATNDLTNFLLNTLHLNSTATGVQTIDGAQPLAFVADNTGAHINQNGSGTFTILTNIKATSLVTLGGSGTGTTQLIGEITEFGGLTFDDAKWQLSNPLNTFGGGVTINAAAYVEVIPAGGGDQGVNLTPTGPGFLGSGNLLTINGGTLKITTSGSGGDASAIIVGGRTATFGQNGGTIDLRNASGTPGAQGGGIATTGGGDVSLTMNNDAANPAIIQFNGGELGLSTGNANDGNWSTGNNALRINTLAGTGPLRIELTNGAMLRGSTSASGTINVPLTIRGVVGGDPSSGVDGTVNTGLSRTTGRVAIDNQNITNHTQGLIFEGAVQVGLVGTTRALDGNIVIAGTASGNPGHVAFTGRGTNTQLNATVNNPGTAAAGQNVIWLGQGQNDTLTIEDGGIARFDPRLRTDTGGTNGNGVLLDGTAVIKPGGTLRIAQSISNFTPGIAGTSANVGDIIIRGDIRGEGSSLRESVFEIALPSPQPGATVDSTIPATLTATTTVAGERPYGGLRFEDQTGLADLVVNGTGFGGLRINGVARPNALIEGGVEDPVSTVTKINDVLTPARLTRVSGTGGYLTIAPAGQTYPFPANSQWNDPDIGLKIIDHHAGGADVSFGSIPSFVRTVAIDAAATLDVGANNPFQFQGPFLHGKGTVIGGGSLAIGAASSLSPGLDDLGTLTINTPLTLGGTLVIGVAPTASDLLHVGSNLTLAGPLNLNGTYGNTTLEIARYTGTLTGTFGSISGLHPDFAIDYGSGTNSSIRLVLTVLPTLTWEGTPGNVWSVGGANWKGGATFTNGNKVQLDDTAAGSTAITIGSGDVSPNLITVNNTAKDYSITSAPGAAIIGGAQLVKDGSGVLTLTGPASFGGGITVNAGELRTGASESLPNNGSIVIGAGAILNTQSNAETVGELTVNGQVSGSGTITVAGLTLGNGASFAPDLVLGGDFIKAGASALVLTGSVGLAGATRTFNVAAGTSPELTLNGVVSNGAITKNGPGTLVLTNPNNSFIGGLNVLAGRVRALVARALADGNNVTVADGAVFEATGFNSVLGLLDLSGSMQTGGGNLVTRGIAGGATGVLTLGNGSLIIDSTGDHSYAGEIVDASTLTKSGVGRQVLSGNNSISGGIQHNAGVLGISGVTSAGSGAIDVAAAATLDLGANIANVINLSGGTIGNTGARNFNGTLNVTAPSIITNSDPDNPGVGADFVILGNGLQGTGNLTVRGIAGVAGADPSSGVRFRSTALSEYTGTITVLNSTKMESQMLEGGTNPIGQAKVQLTAGTVTGNLQGTYPQFNVRTAGGNPILGNNVEVLGTGIANINPVNTGAVTTGQQMTLGNLRIGDGQTIAVNKNDAAISHTLAFTSVTLTGGNATFSPNTPGFGYSGSTDLVLGTISEIAPSGVIMDGQATLLLNAANSYTGATTIQNGTTQLGAAGALPPATSLNVTGGTLDFHNGAGLSFDQTVRQLSGGGGIITNSDVAARTLTVDQIATSDFAGTLSGSLALTKQGTGSLTLSGVNSHSGATTVQGGTLLVNGSSGGASTVRNGAVLGGIGVTGSIVAENGATIAPGTIGSGVLTTGNLTLENGARLRLELNGTNPGSGYDHVNAAGAVSLISGALLELTLGFDPADRTDVFRIILNDLGDPIAGTFAGLPNGAEFAIGAQAFQISYQDDAATATFELSGGNDVSLLAIPEPGVLLTLAAGIGTLLGLQRFRRRAPSRRRE